MHERRKALDLLRNRIDGLHTAMEEEMIYASTEDLMRLIFIADRLAVAFAEVHAKTSDGNTRQKPGTLPNHQPAYRGK